MLTILKAISEKSLLLNEGNFSEEQFASGWIGLTGAGNEKIAAAERRLGCKLPADYAEFIGLTNGFPYYGGVSPSFMPIETIDYLRVLDEDLVEIWRGIEGLEDDAAALSSAILIGGYREEQYLLLVPDPTQKGKWSYWFRANWLPEEVVYSTLMDYLEKELTQLEKDTEGLREPAPKSVVDYRLRDAIFALDWKSVYELASEYIKKDTIYWYFNGISDLY